MNETEALATLNQIKQAFPKVVLNWVKQNFCFGCDIPDCDNCDDKDAVEHGISMREAMDDLD